MSQKNLYLLLGVSALIIAFSVAFYLVIFLPKEAKIKREPGFKTVSRNEMILDCANECKDYFPPDTNSETNDKCRLWCIQRYR